MGCMLKNINVFDNYNYGVMSISKGHVFAMNGDEPAHETVQNYDIYLILTLFPVMAGRH